jgi:L,D-transpeptidase catalytic domain
MRAIIFFPASLLAAALAICLAAPASANILVNIDKTTQTMAVSVDGAQRYVWPVSTGRPGYDTPNGSFKPNRMDADHLSQEWDNAPMPHAIFFDMNGHAIHGFFDTKHLGLAVSHGCVRLSPDHATTLFGLVKAEGMASTSVIVSGRTPPGGSPEMVRRQQPEEQTSLAPMQIVPDYDQQQGYYGRQPYPAPSQPAYAQPQQPAYSAPQPNYGPPPQPYYSQQQSYYRQPPPPPAYGQPQTYYRQPDYAQPANQQPSFFPPQPPPARGF